jgi:hypothetical protein
VIGLSDSRRHHRRDLFASSRHRSIRRALVVGFVAGGFALVVGRYAFAVVCSPVVRLVIGLLFAVPAARAGYDSAFSLAHIGCPSEWWREAFAVVAAITVGGTISILTEPALGGGVALGPAHPPIGATAKGR